VNDRDLALLKRTFRAGSDYELLPFERLTAAEQLPLDGLRSRPDFYGVLVPREGSGRTVKAVGKDTALLWLTLTAPGRLPLFACQGELHQVAAAVSELLLDGVLEVEHEGEFVGGPRAAKLLVGPTTAGSVGTLARLSLEALRHGAALGLDRPDGPRGLAGRLYAYHRQPLTPGWARRVPDRAAALALLAPAGGSVRAGLESRWEVADADAMPGWIAFTPQRSAASRRRPGSYKLYVSPEPEALPAAFGVVVERLARGAAQPFKVGADAQGFLRPDKMVLYFGDLESVLAAASELTGGLAELPPHGVPFTAEIALDGLLSWGMDPPRSERLVAWDERESWRVWVVKRLAAALLGGREGDAEMPPWRFALERLRREGVDVDRWTPSTTLWHAA